MQPLSMQNIDLNDSVVMNEDRTGEDCHTRVRRKLISGFIRQTGLVARCASKVMVILLPWIALKIRLRPLVLLAARARFDKVRHGSIPAWRLYLGGKRRTRRVSPVVPRRKRVSAGRKVVE